MSALLSAGVFFGIQHSSIPGYLRGHSLTQTYTYGQALDAIVNLSVVLSREEVPAGEEACFTRKFWSLPGRSTTTLKKAICCLAGQEAVSATGASPVIYTAATVPLDVLSFLVVGGYVPLARDPDDHRRWIVRVLSNMRKDERAMKPLDELIVWYERQRLSRTRMDAASRAEQDRKSRETRAGWSDEYRNQSKANQEASRAATDAYDRLLGMERSGGYDREEDALFLASMAEIAPSNPYSTPAADQSILFIPAPKDDGTWCQYLVNPTDADRLGNIVQRTTPQIWARLKEIQDGFIQQMKKENITTASWKCYTHSVLYARATKHFDGDIVGVTPSATGCPVCKEINVTALLMRDGTVITSEHCGPAKSCSDVARVRYGEPEKNRKKTRALETVPEVELWVHGVNRMLTLSAELRSWYSEGDPALSQIIANASVAANLTTKPPLDGTVSQWIMEAMAHNAQDNSLVGVSPVRRAGSDKVAP